MNDKDEFGFNDAGQRAQSAREAHARAIGSPLPVGKGGRSPLAPYEEEIQELTKPTPPPGRSLPPPQAPPAEPTSGLQRAMGAFRLALPFVQKVLPLLDGNFGTAVANILTPHPQAPPPTPPVDLEPIENGLAELRSHHRDLRNQILVQNTSLKRVEDQLEMVREATDRNTLEQQELLEDLKAVGNKMTVFATLALLLLVGSVALNVILYLHIQRSLP